jgi:predicted Zn-dependent protease
MLLRLNPTRRRIPALGLAALTAIVAACAISQSEEIELGRQYAAEINRQLPIVDDPAVNRYVSLLGDQISSHGRRKIGYTFFVVNTDQVNAFALPGGFVYVNRGLIEQTANLSELAGVLAHEIAHVEERHSVKQLERVQRANLGGALASILLGGAGGGLAQAGINVAGTAILAGYSREAESEADSLGVILMVESGIDPTGMVTFFKRLLAEHERQPSLFEQWFSTHPLTEERIATTRAEIAALPPASLRNLTVDSRAYETMKAQLRQYPQPPPQFRTQR